MFNLGPEKLMVVLFVALIVLGPDKLPNAARQVGKFLAEFRRISSGFQTELRSAMDLTETAPREDPVAVANAAIAERDPADDEDPGSDEDDEVDADAVVDADAQVEATTADPDGALDASGESEPIEMAAALPGTVEAAPGEADASVEGLTDPPVDTTPLADGIPLGVEGPSTHAVEPEDDRGPQLESPLTNPNPEPVLTPPSPASEASRPQRA